METTLLTLLVYYMIANALYVTMYLLSSLLVRLRPPEFLELRTIWPKVTAIVPACNEEEVIARSVSSLLDNRYPNLEVVVVNDGSRDATLEKLREKFQLKQTEQNALFTIYVSARHANLIVIDKDNSGKAHSLNLALNYCQGEYVVTVDADTFLERDALFQTVAMIDARPNCMGVGGSIRILNGAITDEHGVRRGHLPTKAMTMFQVVEYIRAFFAGRLGWEFLGGTALLSGAFALFRTEALRQVGGFDAGSVTEDFEIVVRMKRHFVTQGKPCDLHMIPAPAAWTIVPETTRSLFWQRVRWQKGLVQTLWSHRRLLFNPAYGRMGLLTLPYMLVFEAFAPLMELVGYIAVGWGLYSDKLPEPVVFLWFGLGVTMYILITVASIRLEEMHYARHDTRKSMPRFVFYSVLENFGYRQFIFAARLVGTLTAYQRHPAWGAQNRAVVEERKAA